MWYNGRHMDGNIFLQVSALMGVTVSIAFFMRLMRQPLLIAYIIAGIVAGPLFLDLIHGEGGTFEALAEFGVILLLFLVGLSLDMNHIKKIGKVALTTGLTQVSFTAGIGFGILQMMGFDLIPSVYMALALTFSSTIIISKLLSDKRDTESVYGRHVFGLMIVQDIIAIGIMIFLSTANGSANIDINAHLSKLALNALALGALVYLMAKYFLPKILDHVAKSSEFLFIFTIAWCFGMASLLHWTGFSLEIGAIIAGLTLGSSPYQPEISSRIRPLRDFFIVLFFIILGSEMGITDLGPVILPGIILSLFILLGNPFILYHSFRLLKFTRRNSFLAGVTAAQVSEFGFILIFTGNQLGHLQGEVLPVFTVVALVTIFVSSYVITYNEQLYRFLLPVFNMFGKDKYQQIEDVNDDFKVWVFGYHRIGWKVCEMLEEQGIKYAVVDFNPRMIAKLKHRGIPAYFGDAADVEFLSTLPLNKARLVVSTLPEADDQLTLITHIKKYKRHPKIIANLYRSKYVDVLYDAGADYVMMPHLLGGAWISRELRDKPWTKKLFRELKKEQRQEMHLRTTAEVGEA